ncbi:hypothetical protein G6045_29125 [Streptomyces sp. YC504]|uniref:D-isomer specific 2-hydroxyacid dehydrogenase NAD-binding domain-containing protein n=1 Tax=Streptomyces mesophilus TaxID=1775132 RepID=A0A6G4XSD0_9ACTN|nr:NAD(P)-dependent oxidoreductase [Streptomyces mesophilus]NGO79690.1 hypothetical protein [Streptomyces mesophilus]
MGDSVVVGISYPPQWDVRPEGALAAALAATCALDPRIELVDCRYVEPDSLRTARSAPPPHDHLRDRAPELTGPQRELFARAEVILTTDLPLGIAALAPNLRWVQGIGAGVGQLLSAGLDDIRVTTAAGVNAASVAEFALARLLEHAKRLREIDEIQRIRGPRRPFGTQLGGRTLGVIGLGRIGTRIAAGAHALGMRVLAVRRDSTAPRPACVDEVYAPSRLHAFLPRCDAVIEALDSGHPTARCTTPRGWPCHRMWRRPPTSTSRVSSRCSART